VREIRAEGASSPRVPLAVPSPCQRSIAGMAALGSRFYYGVCAETDGAAATTVYTIDRDPEYARTDAVLEGCTPIGSTLAGESAWFVGACGEGRKIARFVRGEDVPTTIDFGKDPLRCVEGRPVIPIGGGVGSS
jgi:hypothetical protein